MIAWSSFGMLRERLGHEVAGVERENDGMVALGAELAGQELLVAGRGLPVDARGGRTPGGARAATRTRSHPPRTARPSAPAGAGARRRNGAPRRARRGRSGVTRIARCTSCVSLKRRRPNGPVQRSQARRTSAVPRRRGTSGTVAVAGPEPTSRREAGCGSSSGSRSQSTSMSTGREPRTETTSRSTSRPPTWRTPGVTARTVTSAGATASHHSAARSGEGSARGPRPRRSTAGGAKIAGRSASGKPAASSAAARGVGRITAAPGPAR